MNATDAFYETVDEAEMVEFKKLCDRNTELAHQNLAFRICLRNTAKKLRASRNKPLAEHIETVLGLNPEGV